MESGQNQVINVSKTTSSSINSNNQKENFAEGSGSGATAANTTGSLKSGVPLPKPNLNPTSTGKKVGSKSKKNVEQHNNNNGSSGDAATS